MGWDRRVVFSREWRIISAWIILTSMLFAARLVPNEWRKLYILIAFKPARSCAV